MALLAGVSHVRRIIVLAVLAIWMMATQHCTLEAAGLLAADADHAEAACCEGLGNCAKDSCQIVEGAVSHVTNAQVKAPAPASNLCLCVLCLVQLVPDEPSPKTPPPSLAEASRGWVPTWHFARRAAPSPRAPSLALA